jgi:hypothetical protein
MTNHNVESLARERIRAALAPLCYKIRMKTSVRWVLFEYHGRQLVGLSKPFKTKKEAENARLKYPVRKGRRIGVGMVRTSAIR